MVDHFDPDLVFEVACDQPLRRRLPQPRDHIVRRALYTFTEISPIWHGPEPDLVQLVKVRDREEHGQTWFEHEGDSRVSATQCFLCGSPITKVEKWSEDNGYWNDFVVAPFMPARTHFHLSPCGHRTGDVPTRLEPLWGWALLWDIPEEVALQALVDWLTTWAVYYRHGLVPRDLFIPTPPRLYDHDQIGPAMLEPIWLDPPPQGD